MKRILLASVMVFLFASMASAAQLNFTNVTGVGTYYQDVSPRNLHELSYLTDTIIPGEGNGYELNTVYFYDESYHVNYDKEYFTFDMGALYSVEDFLISVDNNDNYHIDYSVNGTDWILLKTISGGYGEVGFGMDTMSSDSSHSEYLTVLDFGAVEARYLRLSASYYRDVYYSIGEFQVFGTAVQSGPTPEAVPEPSTMLLLGAGLAGLALLRRKMKH